ncbi:hypothetical protein JCM10908_004601 [Rhodotorula pacifica]|uniref:uncharacterized protein n=1 Tax=Rhodotorula pacifica TaxID=1495444 RepID=UPI00317747E4
MPATLRVQAPPPSRVGDLVPALTPHAVSVALPKWQDNVDYEEGAQRIKDAMTSGYPRFFIHHQIQQLADLATSRFGRDGPDGKEACILLPTETTARSCSAFLSSREKPVTSRVQSWAIQSATPVADGKRSRVVTVWACFFPASEFAVAKQYWQHTGEGISSRVAERCLVLLGEIESTDASTASTSTSAAEAPPTIGEGQADATRYLVADQSSPTVPAPSGSAASRYGNKGGRYQVSKASAPASNGTNELSRPPSTASKQRYSTTKVPGRRGSQDASSESSSLANSIDQLPAPPILPSGANGHDAKVQLVEQDEDVLARYVEERYGRNLDLSLAPLAKLAMRRRIAGVLSESPGEELPVDQVQLKGKAVEQQESSRGVQGLTEDDVWLYPCGMNAIFHAHQLAMHAWQREGQEVGKSVCFGFPYTDTLKILEKWGPGCHFFGLGLTSDLPSLRKTLEAANPPVLSLFCEFPSNPLLRSPPLHELRKLADEFGFLIVVDETIAGFVNVETLPPADIVVSSLTKVFSGDSNVMGGSLVLNPKAPHYAALKAAQEERYEDAYFDEDAIYMERNSRDFQARVAQENHNAEMLCDYFRTRRVPGPPATGIVPPADETDASADQADFVVSEVYYPKYQTPEEYLALARPPPPDANGYGNYGALFSLTFSSILASRTFFDALPCYKGPSLGTNFTLACPYTILAHYTELGWAKEFGVEKGLVRISTGLEEPEMLKEWFADALAAAERAVKEAKERGESIE